MISEKNRGGYMVGRDSHAQRTMLHGYRILIGAAALFWLAGCAGPKAETSMVFFPPPPNLPRIQFLAGINDSRDVEGRKDTFKLVSALGAEEKEKIRPLSKPYGIAEHDGKIYLCDTGTSRV